METTTATTDRDTLAHAYHTEGYCIVRNLLNADEIEMLKKHFQALRDNGVPGKYEPVSVEEAGDDILKAYPRVPHPHRWDPVSRQYMLDPRVMNVLAALAGEEVYAAQSMMYFKPPGGRGQSLHQDQFYLQVKPGTCIAAWTALDSCDKENGAMMVAPRTHDMAIDCRNVGKLGSYQGGPGVPVPADRELVMADMEAGDTLFFNGSLIHGSARNTSTTRWRRAFICHYVGKSVKQISQGYLPLVDKDGRDVQVEARDDGGVCGGYVAQATAAN